MKNSFIRKKAYKLAIFFIFIAFTTSAYAATMAEAQKAYVSGKWKEAATAYEQVCPTQTEDARTECYLWDVLALSQTGNAVDFTKAGKRLDSLILKTNPQKKVYADLVMTRAQFQLYLGKFDKAADDLVHAIETSKPEHATVLKKICVAVQSKSNKENLKDACASLANAKSQPQPATAGTAAPATAPAPQASNGAVSKPATEVLDLPDFDSEEKASEKKSVPAAAVQSQQNEIWVLQLGAFSMKPNAETLANNLKKRKIPCNIIEIPQDSRTLFVVQTGEFDTKEKAVDYGAKNLSPINVDFRPILKK